MIPGSANPLLLKSAAAAAGGYQVSRSLRFNSSDSASCARTFSSGSSTTTQTLSLWVKRAKLGATGCFWGGYDGSAAYGAYFQFESSDALTVILGGASLYQLTTTQVFRDPSSWYHIVLTIDTNNGTSGDRIRLYVNGSRVTTFSTASYPTSGYGCQFALGNANNKIGTTWGSSAYSFFDGYLADIHFIDGQALTPSSFTEVSATTGQLIPKAYSGSFGTNGFWLKFSDNSAATAATLGKDYSGNSNNWTPNNLSVTAGAGNDSLVDTPTSYGTDTGVGNEVRGNYCTWNPLDTSGTTLSNGNLDAVSNGPGGISKGTFAVSSGKWYWEVTKNANNTSIGIALSTIAPTIAYVGNGQTWSYYSLNGFLYTNGSGSAYGATYANGDVVGIALDLDNDTLTFYKNGVSQGTAATGLTGTYTPAFGNDQSGPSVSANFGQRAFAYQTPGTNRPAATFKALCDTNLPAPLTAKPNTVMDVKLYTGNGSTQTISGLAFSPDLVWLKSRSSGGYAHRLNDTVREATKELYSNLTSAEFTDASGLTAFNSDGFSVGSTPGYNENTGTYVAWAWDAGTSTVSNTAGSITSQVRANATAGFSVITYTGTGASATVGHGLGVAPSLIIARPRDATSNWIVYHASEGAGKFLRLNTTGASTTDSSAWNNTTPTSTVYSVGNNAANGSGLSVIAYCFSPVVGYSSMGSYVGNGSADGPFVYTGFRPRWILIKWTTATEWWWIFDTARDTYNASGLYLGANAPNAENDLRGTYPIDILSNGFKIRNATYPNGSQTAIYAAFAEAPFQYARAR